MGSIRIRWRWDGSLRNGGQATVLGRNCRKVDEIERWRSEMGWRFGVEELQRVLFRGDITPLKNNETLCRVQLFCNTFTYFEVRSRHNGPRERSRATRLLLSTV